jgi:hypothetical protein
MSAIYRVQQFVRAAGTWVRPTQIDDGLVRRYLPPAAVELFRAMPAYDRRHALAVFHSLRAGGHAEPDLLAAALVHDVGKTLYVGGSVRLWHRVTSVLLRRVSPALLERMGADRPGSWRQPFFVQQHHAAIGAELARQAGCNARTVELIEHHEQEVGGEDDDLLSALRAADSLN